jgi:hypothetical protein
MAMRFNAGRGSFFGGLDDAHGRCALLQTLQMLHSNLLDGG